MRHKYPFGHRLLTLGAASALAFAFGCGGDSGGGNTDDEIDASSPGAGGAGGSGRTDAGSRNGGSGGSASGGSGGSASGGGGSGGSGGGGAGDGSDAGSASGGSGGSKDAGGPDAGAATDSGAKADGGTTSDAGAGAAPTFNEIYDQILGPKPMVAASSCQGSNCHTGKNPKGVNFATIMTAYTTLKPLVKANSAATSTFYKVLIHMGVPADEYMPDGKPKLPDALIEKVKLWIDAGALPPK